jgi:antitoxin (DNA-binding transcriptional repressor) of toxin-antitoxin stability system
MEVTLNQFRKNLSDLVDGALKGESVCLNYKGQRIRLIPEAVGDPATKSEFARFRNITPIDLFNKDFDIEDQSWKLEMMKEIEADGKEL